MSIWLRALPNGEAIGRQKQGGAMECLVDTSCRDAKVSIWSNRRKDTQLARLGTFDRMELKSNKCTMEKKKKITIDTLAPMTEERIQGVETEVSEGFGR